MASSVIHAWEFVYEFLAVGGSYQHYHPLAQLQLVSSASLHGGVCFRAACISV
jgi:hypothetical protein